MSIFDGMSEILDNALGLDDDWEGNLPRYKHETTLIRLCNESVQDLDGPALIHSLYNRAVENWCTATPDERAHLPIGENWRFEKQLGFADHNASPETMLERTIVELADENWANQVPVDSGLLGRSARVVDLLHRAGSKFSILELKVESNTPLSAAFQVVMYGAAYLFSRTHALQLRYDVDAKEVLRASEVHLRVLAPAAYYPQNCNWLANFEESLSDGLNQFAIDWPALGLAAMSFAFESFSEELIWNRETDTTAPEIRRDLLWEIHNRSRLFPD